MREDLLARWYPRTYRKMGGWMVKDDNHEVLAALQRVEQHMRLVLAEERVTEDDATVHIMAVGMLARAHAAVRTILLLREHGLPFDMVSAGRILHETAIVARWISRRDREERAEKFLLSGVLRTQDHLDITEKAHGSKLDGTRAAKQRLSLEAVARRFPASVRTAGKTKKKGRDTLVPNLLTMAREEADLVYNYNYGFSLHSIHAHCDPRSVLLAAFQDLEGTAQAALRSSLTATIRIVNSCGALLERTDHEGLVDELVALVYRVSGGTPPKPPS